MEAMYTLSRMLTREEPATARRYYEQAAAHGDAQAMAKLGDMLAKANRGEARQWYERGQRADLGSIAALRQLAGRADERRRHGSGRRCLEQVAALGDARAMALLAMAALRGRHRDQALAWAEKATAASKEEDPQKLARTYEVRMLRYIGRRGTLPFRRSLGRRPQIAGAPDSRTMSRCSSSASSWPRAWAARTPQRRPAALSKTGVCGTTYRGSEMGLTGMGSGSSD